MESLLKKHNIVPDVLPDITSKVETLEISYGDHKVDAGGKFSSTQARMEPTFVSWNADNNKFYTLFMTDPDCPSREDNNKLVMREFIHWVVTDVPGKNVKSGKIVEDYLGPGPFYGSGLHRYCFFVYEQKEKGIVNVDEAKAMFDKREKCRIVDLVTASDFGEPVAATMFFAEWEKGIDDYHFDLNFMPPIKYRSPWQKSVIIIYGVSLSQPVRSVLLLAKVGNILHRFKQIDFGYMKSPEFLKINPAGQIPAITHDDFCLSEAAAILMYLANINHLNDWYPSNRTQRALVNKWMHWHHSNTRKLSTDLFRYLVFNLPRQPVKKFMKGKMVKILTCLNNALKGKGFIAGTNTPTIADLLIMPDVDQMVFCKKYVGSVLDPYPNIKHWLESMKSHLNNMVPGKKVYDENFLAAKTLFNSFTKAPLTIYYFDVKGLAYPSVLAAAYYGKRLHWEKVSRADWATDKHNIKAKCKFSQLPILVDDEEGGLVVSQSTAILQYLGKKWGKNGNNLQEFGINSFLIECATEIIDTLVARLALCQHLNFNHNILKAAVADNVKYFDNCEKICKNGKFSSEILTGDFALFSNIDSIMDIDDTVLDNHPNLKAWYNSIAKNDNVRYLQQSTPTVVNRFMERFMEYLINTKTEETKSAGMTFHSSLSCKMVPLAAAYWNIPLRWETYNLNDPKSPFSELPVLVDHDEGDLVVSKEYAVLRYLGKKFGKNGSHMQELGWNNSLIECASEMYTMLIDPRDVNIKGRIPKLTKYYDNLQKLLEEKADGKFSSEILTGDLALFNVIYTAMDIDCTTLDKHNKLKAWYQSIVTKNPSICGLLKAKSMSPQDEYLYYCGDKFFRRKIALVGSNVSELPAGEKTGAWSEEVTTPYYIFMDAGYDVQLYSVKGGQIVIDEKSLTEESMKFSDKRSIYDPLFQFKRVHSKVLKNLNVKEYDMIFFAGGHGPLVDYLTADVKEVIEKFWNAKKVVASVCHGPICFANVSFLRGKKMTGFSKEEDDIVGVECPVILETRLTEGGALYSRGPNWQPYVVSDQGLVTGQNPASSEETAKTAIAELRKRLVGQRTLGRQGLVASAQGYGAMGLTAFYGAAVSDEQVHSVLKRCAQLGINFIDTAEVYSAKQNDGTQLYNETVLGKAMKSLGRKNFVICTKHFPRTSVKTKEKLRETIFSCCNDSLKRLQVETIDLYYLHRMYSSFEIEDVMEIFADLVKQGKVKYLGLSEASPNIIRRAHAVHPLSAIQQEWSLIARDLEAKGSVVDTCRELGIGIVPYSPVARGFLSGKFKDKSPTDWRSTVPYLQEEHRADNVKVVDRIEKLAKDKNMTLSQLSLAWVMNQGVDVVPIPGTTKIAHLEENAAAATVKLTAEELNLLSSTSSRIKGERGDERYMSWSFQAHK